MDNHQDQFFFHSDVQVIEAFARGLKPITVDGKQQGYTSVVTAEDLGWNGPEKWHDGKLSIDCTGQNLEYHFPYMNEGR